MAVSGSRDFIQTRDDIIKAALRKIGAVAPGDSPTAAEVTDASNALNSMVLSWQNEDIFLWSLSDDTVSMVASTANYTLDSDVLDISDAFIRDSDNYDTPVDIITREEYKGFGDKTTETTKPSMMYVDYQLAAPVAYMYPVPSATHTLHFTKVQRVQDFDVASNNPDFPVRWSQALIYGLAASLSHEYGLSVEERTGLYQIAEVEKTRAKAADEEQGSLLVAPYRGFA